MREDSLDDSCARINLLVDGQVSRAPFVGQVCN